MKQVYGYVRVSTPRQGEHGVSLQQQRDAILRYCEKNGLEISQWFEERETAAKSGRREFNEMLRRLKSGAVSGVVIHKIDRSARNLKDWASMGELLDSGIQVHFANESLDLNSRGGRLSADIQAVVAADFIRNLREEVRKGFYGRLKQGLLPRPAPPGYQDNGPGKPKSVHPVYGPLVRKGFELYATGQYGLDLLVETLYELGLRTRNGKRVARSHLASMLRNPFYIGIIKLQSTGETFPGVHPSLISKDLFDRVQDVLSGKTKVHKATHKFLYRRALSCATCGRWLIGERQKGHAYYRCHNRTCPVTSVREEHVEASVSQQLQSLSFTVEERRDLQNEVARMEKEQDKEAEALIRSLKLKLDAVNTRLKRVADLLIDGIDRDLFNERKEALLKERMELEEKLKAMECGERDLARMLSEMLERCDSAWLSHKVGTLEGKRELLETVSSNRKVSGKIVCVELKPVFQLVANRPKTKDGVPSRTVRRTFLAQLCELLMRVQINGGENTRSQYLEKSEEQAG